MKSSMFKQAFTKNLGLPVSITPSFVVLSSVLYTLLIVGLVLMTFAPMANAKSEVEFSNKSNASMCSTAARLATLYNYVSREDITLCTKAIRIERLSKHDLAITYNNRGVLYKKLNRHNEALRDYYQSRNLDRDVAGLYVNIGNVYYSARQFTKALHYYDKALKMDAERDYIRSKALANRGLVNERLGNIDAAIDDYRSALQLAPDSSLPSNRLQQLQPLSSYSDDSGVSKRLVGL